MSRVSVIVPMFNAERYLEAALDSILAQTHPPSELVMVDDGSTDKTLFIAQNFQQRHVSGAIPVLIVRQANSGPGAARNAGVQKSSGDFISFLDADDLWAPEKLAWETGIFARDPDVELVTGLVENFFSPELDPSLRDKVKFTAEPLQGAALPGAILVRRQAFFRAGGFDATLRFGDFLPWFAKVKDLGMKTAHIERPVMFRRIHLTNFSRTQRQNRRDYLLAAKRILDERRGSGQN